MAINKVELCGVNTSRLPVLNAEEKETLLKKAREGDAAARERYIQGNLRLVLSVIKRFSNSSENADDLFQIGCIGLIKAIDNFDTTLNVRFSTYAVPMIIGEIKRFLRDDGMLCMAEDGVVTPFLAQKDVKLRGLHNIENLLAAAAAVWGEVPVEAIQKVGSTFTGVEHRIEPVRVLDGVTYYNDSIGTSPTRTIAGLRSFNQKLILIAGGYDKHIPYEPLAPEVVAHVKELVLMGATGPRIEKAVREDPNFNEAELPIQHADNMQHAVELARACAKPGDIIILSPASASFDLYPNFEVRGREFKKIVNELK